MSRKPSLLATAIKPPAEPATPSPAVAPAAPSPALTPAAPREPRAASRRAVSPQGAGGYVPPSRANKSAKTHYLPPDYWTTLEELSFRTRDGQGKRVPQERLVAEALNLLFAKYNYPLVREADD